MQFRQTYSFDDVLIVPRYSNLRTRQNCNISLGGCNMPLIMSPMDMLASPELMKLLIEKNIFTTIHRYFKSPEEQLKIVDEIQVENPREKVWFAIGSMQKYQKWIEILLDNGIVRFMVDMAHGDSISCVETIEYLRHLELNRKIEIIAGNVVTKAGFDRLQSAGANGIRCGIGGGSICASREKCKVGVPQLTCILDCAERKNPETILISDGGIRNSGDIVAAIAAGADLCMCGKIFASTDLAIGTCYNKRKEIVSSDSDEIFYKEYRGMASKEARNSVLSYASVEGVSGLIRYTGKTEDMLKDIELNLKAAQSYLGVTNWQDFRKYAKFQLISNSAIIESQTHVIEN